MRYRGQFAYVTGELSDGDKMPPLTPPTRLRSGGSAHRWVTAICVASSNSYESQVWFSGSTEDAFDLVCEIITP